MVDFSEEFDGSDWDAWEEEYLTNVVPQVMSRTSARAKTSSPFAEFDEEQLERMWREEWSEYAMQHEPGGALEY
jgi:hypothetical protein